MDLQIENSAKLDAPDLFPDNTDPKDFKLNEFEDACGVGMNFLNVND